MEGRKEKNGKVRRKDKMEGGGKEIENKAKQNKGVEWNLTAFCVAISCSGSVTGVAEVAECVGGGEGRVTWAGEGEWD